MIRADGLHRSFGGTEVVRGASFEVAPGEVVGLLGPNGAGKTTVLRMLLGLLTPSAGTIRVDGRLGYLPERFTGYDSLTVGGYLRYLAQQKGASRAEVDRVTTALDLGDLTARILGRLSRGQYQRVGWAQALLGGPPGYVLDEPTQGLDPQQVVSCRRLLQSLASDGAAVLFSTHLLAEAAAVCDRVVVMAAGRVVADEAVTDAAALEERFLRLVGEAELS
ncbi:MAG: ABC transporter ATP-binding protein [Acidimicrobiales bacterium]